MKFDKLFLLVPVCVLIYLSGCTSDSISIDSINMNDKFAHPEIVKVNGYNLKLVDENKLKSEYEGQELNLVINHTQDSREVTGIWIYAKQQANATYEGISIGDEAEPIINKLSNKFPLRGYFPAAFEPDVSLDKQHSFTDKKVEYVIGVLDGKIRAIGHYDFIWQCKYVPRVSIYANCPQSPRSAD